MALLRIVTEKLSFDILMTSFAHTGVLSKMLPENEMCGI